MYIISIWRNEYTEITPNIQEKNKKVKQKEVIVPMQKYGFSSPAVFIVLA